MTNFCLGHNPVIVDYIEKKDSVITFRIDSLTGLTIKTVSISEPRTFIGIKLNNKRLTVIDKVYKKNELIHESTSKFIVSGDASETKVFCRVKIKNKRIIEYKFSDKRVNDARNEYDLTGKLINSIRLDKTILIKEYTTE